MLPGAIQRPSWGSNTNYVLGPGIGTSNKVVPPNLDIADGWRPGDEPSAQRQNWWQNDVDSRLAKLASLQFQTTIVNGPGGMLNVRRSNGLIWAVGGSNALNSLWDGAGGATVTYAGEGSTAQFQYVEEADGRPKWVCSGAYSSGGSVATGAFGVWEFDPTTGSASPIVDSGHVLPWTAPTTSGNNVFVMTAYSGLSCAFKQPFSASNYLVRLSPSVSAGSDYFPMFLAGDDAPTNGYGRVAGAFTTLIHVFQHSSLGDFEYDIGNPASPFTWGRFATGINTHGRPLAVKYVPVFGAFIAIMSDGTVYAIPLAGGMPTLIQPGTGHTYVYATICDCGWMAYAAELTPSNPNGVMYYSPDWQNVYRVDHVRRRMLLALRSIELRQCGCWSR